VIIKIEIQMIKDFSNLEIRKGLKITRKQLRLKRK
jgi:hypothetical protein